MFKRHNLRVMLLLVGSLAILTACAGQIQTPATSVGTPGTQCLAFKPIEFDRLRDTIFTIIQIKQYNAAWHKLCGG